MKTSFRWPGAVAPLVLRWSIVSLALFAASLSVFGQANGKLQIHYIDVGQGDGAIVISPLGETIMFDSGVRGLEERPIAYLQQLGVTKVDYLVTSHYHADHCGCVAQVFSAIPLGTAYDRGQPKTTSATFVAYDGALHAKRKTITPGMKLKLDENSSNPVTIDFVALNGNGINTSDENDQSVVAVVRFGKFDAEFGGDLSGFEHNSYHDIESSIAPKVGQVEVYKVNHHGSSHSSNDTWVSTLNPKIAIISCGDHNRYGHPTEESLTTLHNHNVTTYWTERGEGADPIKNKDYVGGDIVIQVPVGGESFVVNFAGDQAHSYASWGVNTPTAGTPVTGDTSISYAWSKNSNVYHYAECKYCNSISSQNLQTGTTPPTGKTLHQGCPR